MLYRVPFENLSFNHRSVCPWTRAILNPRDPGSLHPELCALISLMQSLVIAPQEKYHPLVLALEHDTYGGRSWVRPLCR